MNSESEKPQAEPLNESVEQVAEETEANLVDELTQANFRIEELERALAEATAKVDEQKDAVVRAAAETENIRRRAAMDVEKARKFALEKFVNELLPVLDNMNHAVAGLNIEDEEGPMKALHEGVNLTRKTLMSAVEKFGVKEVDPQGEAFNPEQHQAIGMQPSPDFPANTVMAVMQKGYQLNERLLRPAMVMVSQGS
ncbi:nucleotide exchange factor GrpE [Shewanella sp. 202IG2-18]|uniref:nucleotide exchange factor GrpE n=1 Tax=Parashewanella hymeniacidonis TaxID=2807618 RepID=UPI001961CEE6|nr:nucleotide exchange factor GrpE [Parashewanella hymeniacidonis]MBM7073808.1 nucleotide exchange factor GrpE [Parashewanella hymeniacidonis]